MNNRLSYSSVRYLSSSSSEQSGWLSSRSSSSSLDVRRQDEISAYRGEEHTCQLTNPKEKSALGDAKTVKSVPKKPLELSEIPPNKGK